MGRTGLLTLLTVSAIIVASPALSGPKLRADTPSGQPDMIFRGMSVVETSGKITNACMDSGYTVVNSSANEVTCQVPMNEMQSILTQALIGNSYSTTPQRFMKFAIAPVQNDARVQASSWVETQMAFGQVRRHPYTSDESQNDMMAFLESAGGSYIPGTSFPNYAFFGWIFEKATGITYRGKPAVGLVIRDLIVGSAAYQAGVQPGDVLFGLDGKTFFDETPIHQRLDKVRVGNRLSVIVMRNDQELAISLVGAARPPITVLGPAPTTVLQERGPPPLPAIIPTREIAPDLRPGTPSSR